MGFKDSAWSTRFQQMGDEAESVFEEVYPYGWTRTGLNRPEIAVGKLALKTRYKPDYLTSAGYVEVQGFGQDQIIKLKVEKHFALQMWHHMDMPVRVFLWDSTHKAWALIDLDQLTHDIYQTATLERFPEGKPYWAVRPSDLETEWVPKTEKS